MTPTAAPNLLSTQPDPNAAAGGAVVSELAQSGGLSGYAAPDTARTTNGALATARVYNQFSSGIDAFAQPLIQQQLQSNRSALQQQFGDAVDQTISNRQDSYQAFSAVADQHAQQLQSRASDYGDFSDLADNVLAGAPDHQDMTATGGSSPFAPFASRASQQPPPPTPTDAGAAPPQGNDTLSWLNAQVNAGSTKGWQRFGQSSAQDANELGQDVGVPAGTAVPLPTGKVIGVSPWGFGDYMVSIQRPDGTVIEVGHVEQPDLKVGQSLQGGETVTSRGLSSPISSGPHVEVRVRGADGKYIDPTTVVSGAAGGSPVGAAIDAQTDDPRVRLAMRQGAGLEGGNLSGGWGVGDQGTSFGPYQIHLPAHPEMDATSATDPNQATAYMLPEYQSAVDKVPADLWRTNPQQAATLAAQLAERPAQPYDADRASQAYVNSQADLGIAGNGTRGFAEQDMTGLLADMGHPVDPTLPNPSGIDATTQAAPSQSAAPDVPAWGPNSPAHRQHQRAYRCGGRRLQVQRRQVCTTSKRQTAPGSR